MFYFSHLTPSGSGRTTGNTKNFLLMGKSSTHAPKNRNHSQDDKNNGMFWGFKRIHEFFRKSQLCCFDTFEWAPSVTKLVALFPSPPLIGAAVKLSLIPPYACASISNPALSAFSANSFTAPDARAPSVHMAYLSEWLRPVEVFGKKCNCSIKLCTLKLPCVKTCSDLKPRFDPVTSLVRGHRFRYHINPVSALIYSTQLI